MDFIALSLTSYLFLANVLNRVSRIAIMSLNKEDKEDDFSLKQGRGLSGRVAPPHQRTY